MTKYIIWAIIIAVVLWKGKPFLRGLILKWRESKEIKQKEVNSDLIYVPISSSRTFYFAVKIDEVGGGKATLTVVKEK